jgi:hypothetical protein
MPSGDIESRIIDEREEFRLDAAGRLDLDVEEASKFAGVDVEKAQSYYKFQDYESEHISGYFSDADKRLVLERYLDDWKNPHEISGEIYSPSSNFSYQGDAKKVADMLEAAGIEVMRWQRDIQRERAKVDAERRNKEFIERITSRFEAEYPGATEMYINQWMSIEEIEEQFDTESRLYSSPSVKEVLEDSWIQVEDKMPEEKMLEPEERIEEAGRFSAAKEFEVMDEVSDEEAIYWMVGKGRNIVPDMTSLYNSFMDREEFVNGLDIMNMARELDHLEELEEGFYQLDGEVEDLVSQGARSVLRSRMQRSKQR